MLPRYDIECENCKEVFEIIVHHEDQSNVECDFCHKTVKQKRMISRGVSMQMDLESRDLPPGEIAMMRKNQRANEKLMAENPDTEFKMPPKRDKRFDPKPPKRVY